MDREGSLPRLIPLTLVILNSQSKRALEYFERMSTARAPQEKLISACFESTVPCKRFGCSYKDAQLLWQQC
jgi:hypothetical protein